MSDNQSWEEQVKWWVEHNAWIIRLTMENYNVTFDHLESIGGKLRNQKGNFKNWKEEK